jgi:hypothetical protein
MLPCQKPKKKRQEPIDYPDGPDGKQILNLETTEGRRIYKERTWEMWRRQQGLCAICLRQHLPTFDHEAGRGAGKRDDRIEVDGEPKNAALCIICQSRKGSKRYKWVNGAYVPTNKFKEVA